MRFARTLMLLAAMALAAMALTATSAVAQSEVEVVEESDGDVCVACPIHIEGEAHITALPAGVIVSSCHDEFTGTLGHDGSGTITWVGTQHTATPCPLINCLADEASWPIGSMAELGSGTVRASVRFCLRNPGTGAELHCDAPVDITDTGSHAYEFSTEVLCAGGSRRVEGHWLLEGSDIEIVHHA